MKEIPNFYCGNCLANKARIKFVTLDELIQYIGGHLIQQKAGAKEPLAKIRENPEALALLLDSIEKPSH